ncbi:MAG: M20/M25/M40 family metallo-hydrolase [Pseudomonadota bacterium]
MSRTVIGLLMFLLAPAAMAQGAWLSTGNAGWRILQQEGKAVALRATSLAGQATPEPVYVIEVSPKDVGRLASLLHLKLRHCGGFMFHPSEAAARLVLSGPAAALPQRAKPGYEITQQALVTPALARMEEGRLAATISRLSAFGNRFYSSPQGAEASNWIRQTWQELGKAHPEVSVAQFAHAGYGQQSVIATILGSDKADEVVVLGAHMDSINILAPRSGGVAPGADDDASGIAGLTEVLRSLVASQYKPRRTIKLIAYAAEEVGLRGSQDIAREFRKANIDVVGVLQLDMTNYKGSDKDIYLITDYTDDNQNAFLRRLIAAYLPTLTVGADQCGYACSDHTAWHAQGYAASMPFESELGADNPHIHTKNDTYANTGNQAAHALKFTRLAAAFAVELGSAP